MSRVVPWMCREEWLVTYQNLYNFQDKKSQMKGIKRVQAWKSRSSSKLPLSIEATASLVSATITDTEESQKSPLTARLAMAMAIVRFVNGMVDMEQKGMYARSVQSIADDIGLPDWLVDLRHESTHAAMPSSEVLRVGCQFSLDWLNRHYWQSQINEIQEREERLVNLIQGFVEEYERDLSRGEKTRKRKKKSQSLIKEIVDLTSEYDMWDTVLDSLVNKQGLLIPSTGILEQFSKQWPDITKHSTVETSMDLPKQSFAMWGPLLKAWHKENGMFLSKLVNALIKKAHKLEFISENALLVRYISCWVHFILLNSRNVSKEEKQWKLSADLDYYSILEVTLYNCSSYTSLILPLVISKLEHSPDKWKQKLNRLVQISPFFDLTSHDKSPMIEKTAVYHNLVKHYPCVADCLKSRSQIPTKTKSADWQPCDPSFVSSVPVGALIGCEPMQFEQLELPEELDSAILKTSTEPESCRDDTKDICEHSGDEHDIEDHLQDESSAEMQCETSDTGKEFSLSVIESISQQIWIF